jgi:hypothetical protein
VQQAETQNDPKVKQQLLQLTRLWLLLAHGYEVNKSSDDLGAALPLKADIG